LVSGFSAGASGSSTTQNVPTVGTLPGGAILAATIPSNYDINGQTALLVDTPDFNTAQIIQNTIDRSLGDQTAVAVSPGEVDISINGRNPMDMISDIMAMPIQQPQQTPTIIVDAQSGTIVMNSGVTLGPAVVSHGDLTVSIQMQTSISQPSPFSSGQTAGVQNSVVSTKQGKAQVIALPKAATLQDVASALNAVGATPSDLIAIVEALKQAGAINGSIKVI
jgi:flagellar P-ring protein precursor FlgI